MRVPRRPTVLGRIEAVERRAPTVTATPLSGGAPGPEGPVGPEGPKGGTVTDYGIVEALPTGEIAKGSLCTFKAAATVLWHLIYTGEPTYPWAKIGGPPLLAETEGEDSTTSEGYEAPAGALSLTTPLAGDYHVLQAGIVYGAVAAIAYLSHALGAGSAFDAWAIEQFQSTSAPTATNSMLTLHTGVARGVAIAERFRSGNGGLVGIVRRRLTIDPVRVG